MPFLEDKLYKLDEIEIKKHNQISIMGERGKLECLYNSSGAISISSPVLLLFHPQPNSNGTMYNKILQNVMNLASKMGFVTFTLNFGGVGNSAGKIEDGFGEFLDAASAFKWISERHSYSRSKWVFGFSFGAYIATQLTMRRPEIDGFIFLSTPLDIYDFSFFAPFPVNGLIIHSSDDQIVKEYKILNFFGKNDKCNHIEYARVDEKINHFFQNVDFDKEIGFSIYHYLKKYSEPSLFRKIEEFELMNHKKPFIDFEEYAKITNFSDELNFDSSENDVDKEEEDDSTDSSFKKNPLAEKEFVI